MKLTGKTPLAWKNLTHDWRRLAVSIAGVGFAVLLMFTQVGFRNALFDSQSNLIEKLDGQIFMISRAKFTLAAEKRFPLNRLYQVRTCEGVAGAYPVYTELTTSVLRKVETGKGNRGYPIRSIGIHPDDPVFVIKGIQQQQQELHQFGTALFDRESKQKFDLEREKKALLAAEHAELAGKNLALIGTFQLGTDFAHDGNLVMSADSFGNYFPHRQRFGDPLSVVDIGVIKLTGAAAEHPEKVCQDIRKELGTHNAKKHDPVSDVLVLTKAEFIDLEQNFWDESTPIATIFRFGKIIGFIVGMVICYQVIYSDIADHMPEFATLKAMGYPAAYFVKLVVVQALLLSLVGFIPGTAVSVGIYEWLGGSTGLLMEMKQDGIMEVLLSTISMCIASGMLALRKLLAADPASLF